MMEQKASSENRVLRFFGLESREKAFHTLLWALPYLALMGCALLGASLLIQWLWPVPVWIHAVAICLALTYLFFFLARMRQMALESDVEEGEGGAQGGPEDAPPG